mmetsp:Transcript_10409/g.31331  ORF Transcript_10409/g.31331 Transcript_10409/m.31331 type:complete len:105 (+) Transcript_10409:2-316(+)
MTSGSTCKSINSISPWDRRRCHLQRFARRTAVTSGCFLDAHFAGHCSSPQMSFASRAAKGDAWRRFPMLSGCWKGLGPWPGLAYATGIFTAYLVVSKAIGSKSH